MRLVHTADWHLGQTFGGFSRDAEHARFLAWLLDRLDEEKADALLVCGDVFDQGNPPATAQARWYDFVAELRRRLPRCALIVVGGNHDAAPRLDAPAPVLRSLGVHVVGALPRGDDGLADPQRCLVELRDARGEVACVCAAVPFLRMADLPPQPADAVDAVAAGVHEVYARVLEAARGKRVPIVALGHLHMKGARLTDESERPLFGNAHALSSDLFPDDVAYAALGHLHFAQLVAERVRYSGSPIPLSMQERNYKHEISVVDVDAARAPVAPVAMVRSIEVPRSVDLVRLDEGSVDDVLQRVRELDVSQRAHDEPPFLEVRVRLDAPAPDLRMRVEQALEARPASLGAVRLVRVHRVLGGDGEALADAMTSSLRDLDPVHVLARLYARSYGGEVPGDVAGAFSELLDGVRAEQADRERADDRSVVERAANDGRGGGAA